MPTGERLTRFEIREDRGLSFERHAHDGERTSAWDVPSDRPGYFGRRLGLDYAREVVRYFQRHPERLSERMLEAIVAEPAFHTRNRQAVREGFTGGLTTAATAGWPRPLMGSAQCPLPPWELPSGEFFWRRNGCAGEARDAGWQVAHGRRYARGWLAHVRSDPLSPAVNWLEWVVSARAFRDEAWTPCRVAFLEEVQSALAGR